MKKFSWISFKHIIRKIKLKNYLRELSLVVLGIIITFGTAYLVDKRADKKEFRSILMLINSELQSNLDLLKILESKIAAETGIYNLVRKTNFNAYDLETDEIELLLDEITIVRTFDFDKTAFEVFRTTKHTKDRKQEKLLFHLIRTYGNLENISAKTDLFYKNKERVFREQTESLDLQQWDRFVFGSVEEYLDLLFSNIGVRNFIWSSNEHFNDDDIFLTIEDMEETLGVIESIMK